MKDTGVTHEHFAPNLVAQIPRANKPRDTRFDDRLTSHVCWSVSPLQLLQTSNQNKKTHKLQVECLRAIVRFEVTFISSSFLLPLLLLLQNSLSELSGPSK